jgi:alkaline phosphatase
MKRFKYLILLVLLISIWTVDSFGQKPKYIFVFIGDGMGLAQVHSTNVFLNATGQDSLRFIRFPVQAVTSTRCAESYITDSGASGTAIACGEKTLTGVIGKDSSKTKKLESIAETAKRNGMKVGIITTVSIDHATPSAFYAHQDGRGSYYDIALDLTNSNFDYFGGGSFEQPTGKDKDKRSIFEILKEKDFRVVQDYSDFSALKPSDKKIVAISTELSGEASMPYSIDMADPKFTLAGFTKKGIELLDNPAGFFMMVEGGKVDWACHSNDSYTAMREVLAFDAAINEAFQFYQKHPDETLIIVTADHETGGMSMGYLETGYKLFFNILKNQKVSIEGFTAQVNDFTKGKTELKLKDMMPLVEKNFGLKLVSDEEYKALKGYDKQIALSKYETEILKQALKKTLKPDKEKSQEHKVLYGSNNPFAASVVKIFNNKAGIGWTTYSHTGLPVGTFAIGVGSQLFNGFYENSDIPHKIKTVSGLK